MAIEAALITAVANQGGKPGPKAPQKKVEIAEKAILQLWRKVKSV